MAVSADPKGSYFAVIQRVTADLFTPETTRLGKNIAELVKLNNQALGMMLDGFLWEGDWYTAPDTPSSRSPKHSLHRSLEDRMYAHIRDADTVETDRHKVSQILYKVMLASKTPQVLRDSLPNSVVDLLPNLKEIPRVEQPGCCFAPGSNERKQFDKIAPKLDQYAAGKFFY